MEDVADRMTALAAEAVELTDKYFLKRLDYSEASVGVLEGLVDDIHYAMPGGKTTATIDLLCEVWGAYLGEGIPAARRRGVGGVGRPVRQGGGDPVGQDAGVPGGQGAQADHPGRGEQPPCLLRDVQVAVGGHKQDGRARRCSRWRGHAGPPRGVASAALSPAERGVRPCGPAAFGVPPCKFRRLTCGLALRGTGRHRCRVLFWVGWLCGRCRRSAPPLGRWAKALL